MRRRDEGEDAFADDRSCTTSMAWGPPREFNESGHVKKPSVYHHASYIARLRNAWQASPSVHACKLRKWTAVEVHCASWPMMLCRTWVIDLEAWKSSLQYCAPTRIHACQLSLWLLALQTQASAAARNADLQCYSAHTSKLSSCMIRCHCQACLSWLRLFATTGSSKDGSTKGKAAVLCGCLPVLDQHVAAQ